MGINTTRAGSRGQAVGFTLVELLTAMVVMGVAISIFISLYVASLDLAETRRVQGVAAKLAEEQLVAVQSNPGAFRWPDFASEGSGKLIKLQDAQGKGESPVTVPTVERAQNREKNLYEDCTWEMHARLPLDTSNYVEVVVIIRWESKGRPQVFTLSSTVPRSVTEEA